jgi:hypothetical protein
MHTHRKIKRRTEKRCSKSGTTETVSIIYFRSATQLRSRYHLYLYLHLHLTLYRDATFLLDQRFLSTISKATAQ